MDDERLAIKQRVVEEAVARLGMERDALRVLAEVGGFEIGGMAGIILGAARSGRVVVIDGFISTAAALVAAALCPTAQEYLVAGHCSSEPGHRIALQHLGLRPLLDLDLRLGEASGAALAIPIIRGAAATLREMATFDSAGISGAEAGEVGNP